MATFPLRHGLERQLFIIIFHSEHVQSPYAQGRLPQRSTAARPGRLPRQPASLKCERHRNPFEGYFLLERRSKGPARTKWRAPTTAGCCLEHERPSLMADALGPKRSQWAFLKYSLVPTSARTACLTVNIWTRAKLRPAKNLPVMICSYGIWHHPFRH